MWLFHSPCFQLSPSSSSCLDLSTQAFSTTTHVQIPGTSSSLDTSSLSLPITLSSSSRGHAYAFLLPLPSPHPGQLPLRTQISTSSFRKPWAPRCPLSCQVPSSLTRCPHVSPELPSKAQATGIGACSGPCHAAVDGVPGAGPASLLRAAHSQASSAFRDSSCIALRLSCVTQQPSPVFPPTALGLVTAARAPARPGSGWSGIAWGCSAGWGTLSIRQLGKHLLAVFGPGARGGMHGTW